MHSVWLLINMVLKVIAWGLALLLGLLIAILIVLTITIAYSVSSTLGLATLILFLGLTYLSFYRVPR